MLNKSKDVARLTFLGTGTSQGVPVIACPCEVCHSCDEHDKRLRTSALLEVNGKVLLFDAGPDFRQQLLRYNVQQLDAILLTHEHKDHTGGIDDVRAFNLVMGKPVEIYGEKRVCQAVKHDFAYAFSDEKYPGVPEINLNVISNASFTAAGLRVEPIRVNHFKLPIYGYRMGSFAYVTDANYIPPESMEKLKGLDVLVLNALRKEKHISHFTLAEALEIIAILKPKRAYLTHLSHQMGFHKEVEKELPDNVHIAYDGLELEINGVV